MDYYTIYAHIFPDGCVYIGKTKEKNLNIRWGYSGEKYDNQPLVRDAILLWGWNSIQHIVLEQGDMTREEVLKKECDYTLDYVSKGYHMLNKYNVYNPCRYRVKEIKHTYEYIDVISGKVYDTLRAAATDIGVSHETIRSSIIEQRSICRGKHRFEKRLKEVKTCTCIEKGEEEHE